MGMDPDILHKPVEVDAIFVHFSTDYIFDGTRLEYREGDSPNPINIYGESKLLGEVSIRKKMENYRIIRTSWLFGSHGKNFVDTILSLSHQMPVVRVVNDQVGKPTYTVDLANKIPEIISPDSRESIISPTMVIAAGMNLRVHLFPMQSPVQLKIFHEKQNGLRFGPCEYKNISSPVTGDKQ